MNRKIHCCIFVTCLFYFLQASSLVSGLDKESFLLKRDNTKKILTKIIKVEKTVQDGRRIIGTKVKGPTVNQKRNLEKKSQINSLVYNKDETVLENRIAKLLIDFDLDSNPCDTATQFNYFLPFPSDSSKYIICDPWGTFEVRTCSNGSLWDSWSYSCSTKDKVKSSDLMSLTKQTTTLNTSSQTPCKSNKFGCMNGGSCVEYNSEQKCVCTDRWTGEFCESDINTYDLYHQILFGSFSIKEYKVKIREENVTTDISYYEKYKSKLDKNTYQALLDYLSLYESNSIRYDTLLTALLEDVLDNMYPDAKYLTTFNASEQKIIEIIKLIPSLISYAKYSFEKREKLFMEYVNILDKLVYALNTTGEPTKFGIEATKYQRLTHLFLNKTVQARISHSLSIKFNDYEVKNGIEKESNLTLANAIKLLDLFPSFQTTIESQKKSKPNILNMKLGECKSKESIEVVNLLKEINKSDVSIWDSLVNYGFWYITNIFSSENPF